MKKAISVLSLSLVVVMVMAASAFALNSAVTITATVPTVFSLAVNNATVAFGTLTNAEVEAGKTIANATEVSVKSNKIYTLSYTASDFTNGATLSMPIGTVAYSYAGDKTGSGTLANSGTLFNDGARGNKAYDFDMTLTPGLSAEPADYTSNLVYTALQN